MAIHNNKDQRIIAALKRDFSCPICSQILSDTVLTSCGIKICRYCLVTHVTENKSCPICKKTSCSTLGKPYVKLNDYAAVIYRKVSPKLREERQIYLNRRELQHRKFDLEQRNKADKIIEAEEMERKWRLIEAQLKAGIALEPGSPEWIAYREAQKNEHNNNVEEYMGKSGKTFKIPAEVIEYRKQNLLLKPSKTSIQTSSRSRPSTKSLELKTSSSSIGGRRSSTFLRARSGGAAASRGSTASVNPLLQGMDAKTATALKILDHPSTAASSIQSLYKEASASAPNFRSLEAVNEANDLLAQELSITYDRYLSTALSSDTHENEHLAHTLGTGKTGGGDQSQTSICAGASGGRSRSRPAPVPAPSPFLKKIRAQDLLNQIEGLKQSIRKSTAVINALAGGNMSQESMAVASASVLGEISDSRKLKAMLENALDMKAFVSKRIQECPSQSQRLNDEIKFQIILDKAAELLQAKYEEAENSENFCNDNNTQ